MSDLDNMTMYEMCLLHSRADRALRLVVSRELEDYDITMMQWLLLSTVNKSANGGMRMTELAETLDVTMPQITALMNDLVKLKLAKQKVNASDRRSRRLSVTPLGKRQLQIIEPRVDKALKKWLSDIPAGDIKPYLATIRLLSDMGSDSVGG